MKNYPDYETLCEEYQAGNISAVDFVTQQSDEMSEEYYDFARMNLSTLILKLLPLPLWITVRLYLKKYRKLKK